MTLTCATCDRPFNRALARHTLDGYTHVICPPRPRGLPIDPLAPYLDRITQWPSRNRLRDAVDKAIRRGTISIHLADPGSPSRSDSTPRSSGARTGGCRLTGRWRHEVRGPNVLRP